MREGRAAKRARMGVPDLQVVAVSAQLCRICELGAFCNMLHGLTGGGVGGVVGGAVLAIRPVKHRWLLPPVTPVGRTEPVKIAQ